MDANRKSWIVIIGLFGVVFLFGLIYYLLSPSHEPDNKLMGWVNFLCALALGGAWLWNKRRSDTKEHRIKRPKSN
jgi:4-amino-4-deoxy-L-arabinose transferase-like glycosyltransferase